MHTHKMLLEIVDARPYLLAVSTAKSEALVALRRATILVMYTLLMFVEIIDSGKPCLAALAVLEAALEFLRMPRFMFLEVR